jgi:hypothetical protein
MIDADDNYLSSYDKDVQMPDAVHATRIKDLAHELQKACASAANAGLDVDIDARTVSMISMSGKKSVPQWTVTATVARPL